MNIIYNKSNGSKVDSAQIKLLSMASCVLCHTHFHFFILLLNQLCPLMQCSSYPACFPHPLPIELSLSFSHAHNDNNELYHHPSSTEPLPSLIWSPTSFNISNNSSTTLIDSIRTIDDWEWYWRVGLHPINLFNMKHNAVGDAVSFDFESTFWCGLFDWISMLLKWIIIENTYTNGIVRFSTYI